VGELKAGLLTLHLSVNSRHDVRLLDDFSVGQWSFGGSTRKLRICISVKLETEAGEI
jgi:hypothetical protein